MSASAPLLAIPRPAPSADQHQAINGRRLLGTRLLDVVVSVALLAALAPAFLVITALVRRDGGPAFFGHRRVGRDGVRFYCLKFRTMVVNGDQVLKAHMAADPAAASEWEARRKLPNDPRVTRVGNFLRKTSLDELPQIINVIRGEMSLVGPRPVVVAELQKHFWPDGSAAYLAVPPGITGLWQISGRSDTTSAQRVALDIQYARTRSMGRDLLILLKTVPAVLLRRGAV